jgi:hypothetical protein
LDAAGGNAGAVDPDPYGIPSTRFGDVPEFFYGLLGRIAMLSALLEDRLHVLSGVLAQAPQECLAGKPGTALISACRKHLDGFGEGHRAAAEDYLARAEQALKSRHAVLHSLWPFPQQLVPDEPARGWRNAPPGARARKDWPVEWTDLSADDLPALSGS